MSDNQFTTKEVMIGAALGSLIVSVGAVLMSPKGCQIKRSMSHMCGDISDKTNEITDYMVKKGKCLMNMNCAEPDWSDKAKSLLSDMTCYLTGAKKKNMPCEMVEEHGCEMWVGALAGGIIGAVAGLLIAPKAGNELRGDFADTYENISDTAQGYAKQFQKESKKMARSVSKDANKWLDLASMVINQFVNKAEQASDQVANRAKNSIEESKEKIDKALEWAAFGLRIWKGLNK